MSTTSHAQATYDRRKATLRRLLGTAAIALAGLLVVRDALRLVDVDDALDDEAHAVVDGALFADLRKYGERASVTRTP